MLASIMLDFTLIPSSLFNLNAHSGRICVYIHAHDIHVRVYIYSVQKSAIYPYIPLRLMDISLSILAEKFLSKSLSLQNY